jgi:hypothetical protein
VDTGFLNIKTTMEQPKILPGFWVLALNQTVVRKLQLLSAGLPYHALFRLSSRPRRLYHEQLARQPSNCTLNVAPTMRDVHVH